MWGCWQKKGGGYVRMGGIAPWLLRGIDAPGLCKCWKTVFYCLYHWHCFYTSSKLIVVIKVSELRLGAKQIVDCC